MEWVAILRPQIHLPYTLAWFGDNFAFDDTTELQFGLPVRSFSSFYDASSEAAISRMYGGIHYRAAVDNGLEQGKNLGHFIVQKAVKKKL